MSALLNPMLWMLKLALMASLAGGVVVIGGYLFLGLSHTPDEPVRLSSAEAEQAPPFEDFFAQPRVSNWPMEAGRNFSEAPGLAHAVAQGVLPPIGDRLPLQPVVIDPPEQLGPYGGVWRIYGVSESDIAGWANLRLLAESLLRWDPLGEGVLPNVARSWQIKDDGRVFVFQLREGQRWSDGQLFTAHDIGFWYQFILLNRQLTPVIPEDLANADGSPFELVIPDDYTVEFHFKEPKGLFLWRWAAATSLVAMTPAHYLRPYVPDDEGQLSPALRGKLSQSGLQHWRQLFARVNAWDNTARPTLRAWQVVKNGRPLIMERNPFYWKVDPSGQQLPYIDTLRFEVFDPEIITMRALDGEVQKQLRHIQFQNYPLLMKRRDNGQYRVLHWLRESANELVIMLNLNHTDPVKRELFHDKRFRVALSHALDRDEINEVYFFGMGTPRQPVPLPGSYFYKPGMAERYLDHKPEKTEALLDAIGLERGPDGMRRLPDGRPLVIRIDAITLPGGGHRVLELITSQWKDAGIDARLNLIGRSLFHQRIESSQHDASIWDDTTGMWPILDARFYLPSSSMSYQGPAYARWFTSGGRAGEEPPLPMLEAMEFFRRMEQTVDQEKQREYFSELLRVSGENLWVIGTLGQTPQPVIVRNDFRNVPEVAFDSWRFRTPFNTMPEAYAIDPAREGVSHREAP